MPKKQDSQLLIEGCRSYHKAFFAVMQFRQEVQDAIFAVVDERIADIADALQLDKTEVNDGLAAYADPANFAESWDGSYAEVGVRYPSRNWESKWGIYFYFSISDEENGCARAYCWLKEPGLAMEKLASLGVAGLEINDSAAWISEDISEVSGGFSGAVSRVLDRWIELWRKVGGIQQFLPEAKKRRAQGGA